MDQNQLLALLSELIACHAPPGEEGEIEVVIRREFAASGVKVWQDDATNLVAHRPGPGLRVMVCAHKDEIGLIVTKVEEDGRLRVENCGGAWPWKYGEGPIEVIGDGGKLVRAILSVGSVPCYRRPHPRVEIQPGLDLGTGNALHRLESGPTG